MAKLVEGVWLTSRRSLVQIQLGTQILIYGVMVAHLVLVQIVRVRILVDQQYYADKTQGVSLVS